MTAEQAVKQTKQDKREYLITDLRVSQLEAGQVFGEESILIEKNQSSQYSVEVTSETAEIWSINKFEFTKRLKQVPQTRDALKQLMQVKASQVYDVFKTQPQWSLIEQESYKAFYIECFYKKRSSEELQILAESAENLQVIEETKVFATQHSQKTAVRERGLGEAAELARKKILEKNMGELKAKVDDIEQIASVVDMHPLQRTHMPHMENKKRYLEV